MESLKVSLVILLTLTSSFAPSLAANGGLPAPVVSIPVVSTGNYTCDKHPGVCTVAGSITPNCCKKMCVNFNTDNSNCGECGHKCPNGNGEVCCKGKCHNLLRNILNCGKCGNVCMKPLKCCSGKCVDEKTDILNCGKCGRACGHNQICCSGKIVNFLKSKKHCGGCKTTCKGEANCLNGVCSDYA